MKLGVKGPKFFNQLTYRRVSLDAMTRSVKGKFNCITVNFDKTQHGFI